MYNSLIFTLQKKITIYTMLIHFLAQKVIKGINNQKCHIIRIFLRSPCLIRFCLTNLSKIGDWLIFSYYRFQNLETIIIV